MTTKKRISVSSAKAKGRCRRCKQDYERFSDLGKLCLRCQTSCVTCQEELTLDNILPSGAARNQYRCRRCAAASVKKVRGNRGFNQRAYDLQRHYGLSTEEHKNLHERQNYKCAICQEYMDQLFVDHCHKENKVRGLLCPTCNLGIGYFKDSVILLEKAIGYLTEKKD